MNDQPFKPYWIRVFIFDLQSKKQIREWDKDLSQDGVRRWLSNVTLWACNRHYSVEIVNRNDV